MSTGLELIPIAIAVGVAVSRKRKARSAEVVGGTHSSIYAMETRVRDVEMLLAAIARLGGRVGESPTGSVSARLNDVAISFVPAPDSDVLDAHFAEDVPEAIARELVLALDAIYCRVVQERVREKILQRAEAHGMTLESETVEPDGSIVLTLEVSA